MPFLAGLGCRAALAVSPEGPPARGRGAASEAGYISEVGKEELEGVPAAAGAVVFLYATLTPSHALFLRPKTYG